MSEVEFTAEFTAEFEKRVELIVRDSADDMATLTRFEIKTAAQFELAAEQRGKLKVEYEAIESERDALVRPKNEWVKGINAKAKPALNFLEAAIKLLTSSMGAYTIREEQRQQRALEEVQVKALAGDQIGASLAIAKLEPQVPKVLGLSKASDKWVVVSVDVTKLPAHLLMPDMTKINALVRASKTETPCPGVIARVEKVFTQKVSA